MKRKNLEVMATFSHPLRVEIMRLLSRRKMTVNELAKELPLTSGGVRPHLSYFINRKLLHTERNGRTVYYWLNRERLVEALSEFGDEAGIDVSLVSRWTVEESKDAGDGATKRKAPKRRKAKKKAKARKSTARRSKARKSKAHETTARKAAAKQSSRTRSKKRGSKTATKKRTKAGGRRKKVRRRA